MKRSGGPGRAGLASSWRLCRLCRCSQSRSWGPALALTYLFGIGLAAMPGIVDWGRGWIWSKLGLVLLLTVFHGLLERWRRDFAAGRNARRARFYRIVNELPTVAMIAIVILVVVKPF